MMLEWIVQRPVGPCKFDAIDTITAPDKRTALALAQSTHGEGVTVQSAISLRTEQRTAPAAVRPLVTGKAAAAIVPVLAPKKVTSDKVRPSLRGLMLARLALGPHTRPALCLHLKRPWRSLAKCLDTLERRGLVRHIPTVKRSDGTFAPCTWEVK